jgi:RNA polymerase sigma-70 factor (ECF subfamily)
MFEQRMTEKYSDQELVNEFLAGNESAFNRLAVRYQGKIYWHARRMTGNHFDADEIVQQVLLVMYKKLNTFKNESSLYTWIYKITSTRSLNLIRKNKLSSFLSDYDEIENDGSKAFDIIGSIEYKEKLEMVQRLLQKIPAKQREVFILRNYDELTYKEISEITGKSEGALKASYFHAFNKMKEFMKNE